jgi:hypothetical protein
MPEREWQVVAGDQHLGVFTESQLTRRAATATLPPGALLSFGEGWITLSQFMSDLKIRAIPMTGMGPGVPPTHPAEGRVIAPPPIPASIGEPGGAAISHPLPLPPPSDPMSGPATSPAVAPYASPPTPGPAPSAHADPTADAAPASTDSSTDGEPPERDRIVILGRRQSGKTIYLSGLYAKLWRSLDGLTAKSLRGEVHQQLMEVHRTLLRGEWPMPTLDARHMELELEEAGRKRLMVALDYAGEIFANAFVDERMDIPEVKLLVDHIDRAAAVMMLVDPSIIAGSDHRAATEDDFGLVQAVQRIRNWPNGQDVPVVLVLTKIDQYQELLDRFGGPDGFVRHHFPALIRLLKQVPIFQVSAVQVRKRSDGKFAPKSDFAPMNVDKPLRYCLRKMLKAEIKAETEEQEAIRRTAIIRAERERVRKEKTQNITLISLVALILAVGIAAVVWIIKRGS